MRRIKYVQLKKESYNNCFQSTLTIKTVLVMDSQVQIEGRLLDIGKDDWRKEKLPLDDINVPAQELPDPEADNGNTESLRQQEMKWTDMALNTIRGSSQNEN